MSTIVSSNFEINFFLLSLPVAEITLDLEGNRLCRSGKINTIQLYMLSRSSLFIFDCAKLNSEQIRRCLRELLCSTTVTKFMFDCRSDVDALYHQYGIKINNVVDLQLYEVGYRRCSGHKTRFYSGLSKTLQTYQNIVGISASELAIKDRYSAQFKTQNYNLPLTNPDCIEYLCIDVKYLHKLYVLFRAKIGRGAIYALIASETTKRENIWQKKEFENNRSCAMSVI